MCMNGKQPAHGEGKGKISSRPRVLHVDDNDDTLCLFLMSFKNWFDIEGVRTAGEALKRIEEVRFDAVVTDYEMPEMNGMELLQELRGDHPNLPVIFYTGQGNENVAREAFLSGAADYFVKSLDEFAQRDKVVNSINNAIERARAQEELKKHRDRLEELVKERTAELASANTKLQMEVRKKEVAREQLRKAYESIKEMEHIIDHSPAVAFLWKNAPGWPVEFVSHNVTMFGYTPDDFYSGRVMFAEVLHPDDIDRVAEEVTRHSNEGRKNFTQEYRIFTRDGELRWLDDRTWIRRNPEGVITHYQGIVLDITEKKIAETALMEQRENLEKCILDRTAELREANDKLCLENDRRIIIEDELIRKNKELHDFCQMVSHGLKGPVNIISGFISAINEDPELMNVHYHRVISQCSDLASFIDNLLRLSRAGKVLGTKTAINPVEIITDIFHQIKPEDVNARLEITGPMETMIADPEAMKRVLFNLLENSILYRDPNKEKLVIQVGSKVYGNTMAIIYKDNGSGIPHEDLVKIFLPGFVLKKGKGTGFGMAIAKKLIEAHGGEIAVRSEGENKGVEFKIILPKDIDPT